MKTYILILSLIAGIWVSNLTKIDHTNTDINKHEHIIAKADSTNPFIFVVGRYDQHEGSSLADNNYKENQGTVNKNDLIGKDGKIITVYLDKRTILPISNYKNGSI